ncbi:MAG: 30S ribosomal protein S5 [Candidatus Paceibacterota bacterium]|jgi:small subunit ribosomal protein S5|nr:30S ribosomal protein S5 [Candidatus Paceibacterota bacterium]MDD3548521.1 30S ribosomal protein S5 [Candidatus Paceibacterota bacterium]MDD4999064.1 30S ribosomal protein S5 [Candidatus Paceibacterota bacterium]MDD5545235.1 30S ribosomal protein S5 [Candidatus Paceibacterota bacterium]
MATKRENSQYNNKDKGFEEVLLDIARVTRVVAGGKRLSFRATVAIGDKDKHQVGIGIAKGKDVAQAIQKATNDAKKKLISIVVENETIPYEVKAKYKAACVILKPAQKGKGIIAGGSIRAILRLANISNVSAKMLGHSNNAINNAKATIIALSKLKAK